MGRGDKDIKDLPDHVSRFVRQGFAPEFGRGRESFGSNPIWARLKELGTELWLDTGSIEDAKELWTGDFAALTTNNTLLNAEVQRGTYDSLVGRAGRMLGEFHLSDRQLKLELAFILNAYHGLRLVEQFDAHVSVEEHTDLADDLSATVEYARRYHAICPQRFIVKVPFTAAGLLATRRLAASGVPVNHTLGFSARQNYLIARISRPAYVNVFLGRLNSMISQNGLGDGKWIGEKATLASQAAIRKLRGARGLPTRQIGASYRADQQVRDLAGIDVMTIPPKVAGEFLDMGIEPAELDDRTGREYRPAFRPGVDIDALRMGTLWEIERKLIACIDALEMEDLDAFTPGDLTGFFAEHGCGDVLVDWSAKQITSSYAEGKIPKLDNWAEALWEGQIGLDSLMNLAGLGSFTADQEAMDRRVAGLLAGGGESQ